MINDRSIGSMPKNLFFFIVYCFIAGGAAAQAVTITGRVTDMETDEGISFATIFIKGVDSTISTDPDGYYRIHARLKARSIGARCADYIQLLATIKRGARAETINFELQRIDSTGRRGAILKKTEAAALGIVRKVIRDKAAHDVKTLNSYGYEAYTKLQVELVDLTERFRQRKIFQPLQFVFKNIDSTSELHPFLPFFLTETVSDCYYQKHPRASREIIKASKVSGIDDLSITQFLGSTVLQTDIYNEYIVFLKRQFVSPLSTLGLGCYNYYLEDSQKIDNIKCYKIRFTPRSVKLAQLEGEMWVADSFFAVQKIRIRTLNNPKLSPIHNISLYDEFVHVGRSIWMLKRERVVINAIKFNNRPEMVLRKNTFYNNIIINEKEHVLDSVFSKKIPDITVRDSANFKSDGYWDRVRRNAASAYHEEKVYSMIDTLATLKVTRRYINIVQMFVLGYVDAGPVSIGDLYSFIAINPVDGWRFKYGMRTSAKFSKVVRLGGYGAYGLKSRQFRYGAEVLWLIKKDPRITLSASYRFDLEPNRDYNSFYASPDFWTLYGLRRVQDGRFIPLKYSEIREFRLRFYQEFKFGYAYAIGVLNQKMQPVSDFNFLYHTAADNADPNTDITSGTITEFSITQRFAWHERFLNSNFYHYGLGSKFPIVILQAAVGVKNILGSQFNYERISVTVNDTRLLGLIGRLRYHIEAGKYFGTLPFIFLQVPNASETYIAEWPRFNTITQYQFAADRYLQAAAEHHLDGLLFDRIPGLKKLRLHEVWGAHMWWGDMTAANQAANYANLAGNPENTGLVKVQIADKKPFVEMNAGIENILTFFRIDAVWRATDLDPRGTRFSFRYGNCGVRLSFSLQF
jgi:hypothetical protein